jgi:hypothetical protein
MDILRSWQKGKRLRRLLHKCKVFIILDLEKS